METRAAFAVRWENKVGDFNLHVQHKSAQQKQREGLESQQHAVHAEMKHTSDLHARLGFKNKWTEWQRNNEALEQPAIDLQTL